MSEECFTDDMKRTNPVSTAQIMRAHTKPEGLSDVRWRIELRRRAQCGWNSITMRVAHEPDRLG